MNIVAIIPCRSGSTRIPRKNFVKLHGRPLYAYSVQACRDAGCTVVLSLDEADALDEVGAAKTIRLRPPAIRGDGPLEPVVEDVLRNTPEGQAADLVVLKQPTSPFVRASTIRGMIEEFRRDKTLESATAVVMNPVAAFQWMYSMGEWTPTMRERPATQNVVRYTEGPGLWIFRREPFLRAIQTPGAVTASRQYGVHRCLEVARIEAVDIDTPDDLVMADMIARGMDSP